MNILVTGGSSGLGAAIVKKMAWEKDNIVWFTYANSGAAAKEIESAYKNTRTIHCDFTNTESIEALLLELEKFDIDVLINNASSAIHKEHFHKSDYHVFKDNFVHNVLPVFTDNTSGNKNFQKKKIW